MKKVRMSNGEFATCIEDFEDVIGMENVRSIKELTDYHDEYDTATVSYWKNAYEEMELNDDNKYQQIICAIELIRELNVYVNDATRLNRKNIANKLKEIVNQLENY